MLASVGRVPTGDRRLCAPGVAGRVVPTEPAPASPLSPWRVRGAGAPGLSQELPDLHHPPRAALRGLGGGGAVVAPVPSPRVPRSRSAGT